MKLCLCLTQVPTVNNIIVMALTMENYDRNFNLEQY